MALNIRDSGDPGEKQEQPPKRMGPILHTPKASNPFAKLLIPVGIVLALAVAGYFYYRAHFQKQTNPPAVVILPQKDTTRKQPVTPPELQKEQPAQKQPETAATETKPAPQKKNQAVTKKTTAKEMKKKSEPAPGARLPKEQPKGAGRTTKPVAKPQPSVTSASGEAAPSSPNFSSSSGKFTIFVGSFKNKQNAETIAGRWKDAGYPTHVTTKGAWYRVSIGNYSTKEEGKRVAEKMRDAFEYGYWVDLLQ